MLDSLQLKLLYLKMNKIFITEHKGWKFSSSDPWWQELHSKMQQNKSVTKVCYNNSIIINIL